VPKKEQISDIDTSLIAISHFLKSEIPYNYIYCTFMVDDSDFSNISSATVGMRTTGNGIHRCGGELHEHVSLQNQMATKPSIPIP